MRKKSKKPIPKWQKEVILWELKFLRSRVRYLEDSLIEKEKQIGHFMKYFDNRIELVLSGNKGFKYSETDQLRDDITNKTIFGKSEN